MLLLSTASGPLPLRCDDYYVKKLASGLDELCFSISIWDESYPLIQEESSIQENSGSGPINYLVKAIDGGNDTASIKCQIDLDEWKATLTPDYKSASLSVGAMVRSVAPAGWTVVDETSLTYQRTIELTSATPYDVLQQCRSTFTGVTFRFDNVQRTITVVDMNAGQSIGAFVTRDLNLRQNNYKGKSTGFCTRLYAYGKDGLSFASINGGKPYVDNNTYSSRVICAYWEDNRYTVAANLLEDAQARLSELAVPQRSYSCDVVDLAAVDPAKYSYLSFPLFTVVSLIDTTRSAGAKIDHMVVERWEYPNRPDKNKVVLSTVAPRISSQVSQIISAINDPNSAYNQQSSTAIETALANATAQITGATGGYIRSLYDSSGNWTEQIIMNTTDIATATKVWRWNLGGLGYSPYGYNGPYTTAITQDGAIVANFITTGTLDASRITVSNLSASSINTGTLDASLITVTNLSASSINTGTLDASVVSVTNLSANSITSGTINAESINVTNINGQNIKASTVDSTQLNDGAVTEGKIGSLAVTNGKIGAGAVTGGTGGKIGSGTITGGNLTGGINTSLGYADYANTVFQGSVVAGYMKATNMNATTAMTIKGYSCSWQSVTDQGGNIYLLLRGTQ